MTTQRTSRAIRLSASDVSFDETGSREAAQRFEQIGAIHLPGFLTADFCSVLERIWRRAEFVRAPAPKVGERWMEMPGRAGDGLSLALQRPALLRWLERVTACGRLDDAQGHVARHTAGDERALDWHDDFDDLRRRLAITINLDDQPYSGGVFELRDRATHLLRFSHVHQAIGDALIFRVSPALEHRLTPVTAGGPRTVFAGWFLGAPRA